MRLPVSPRKSGCGGSLVTSSSRQFSEGALLPAGIVSQLIAALVGRVRNITTIAAESPLQLISGRVQVIAARLGASACKSPKIRVRRVLGHIIEPATLRGVRSPRGVVSQFIAALVGRVRNIITIAAEIPLQLISGCVQVIAARLGASACKSSTIRGRRVLGHIIESATLRGCTIAGGYCLPAHSGTCEMCPEYNNHCRGKPLTAYFKARVGHCRFRGSSDR